MNLVVGILVISSIGLLCALGLVLVAHIFAVRIDHRVEQVVGLLPGANCGACGYASCVALAEATVQSVDGGGKPPVCVQGGKEVVRELENILRIEITAAERQVATVRCNGGVRCHDLYEYIGVADCRGSLALNSRGEKTCAFGCLGHGSCARACPFGAITLSASRLPLVDPHLCTGCGKCVAACPRSLLRLSGVREYYYVACSSGERGQVVRQQCRGGCLACLKCTKVCPVAAVQVKDHLAVIDPQLCIGCHQCREACPTGVIVPLVSPATFQELKHLFKGA